ncbi:hypothetical protein FPV67DRAFT_1414466 [Lyophyllum atratum]|nr:hypothetical protein FPV67DRAFT_1414466 [Lyophyllum atratum]
MDTPGQQEKDFLSSMFPTDEQQRSQINMYSMPYGPMQSSMHQNANPELSMDVLNNLMSMQGIDSQPTSPVSPQYNPQSVLEHQFKLTQLQQLQQLQNQIFQQQPYRQDHHLSMHNHAMNSNYPPPRGSTSAPEHIAFRTSLPSPAELDFDISPLTSPWLGAHQHQHAMNHFPSSNKRNASSSGDEAIGSQQPSRKRQSPAIRPINPDVQGSSSSKKYFRGSKSTNSTPLMRSTRSRKGSTADDVPGDTPSPVDLSMPPPAPPMPASSSSSRAPSEHVPPSPQFNPHLTPVTPASIMNLGRLGINHSATGMTPLTRQVMPHKADAKGKSAASTSAAKPKATEASRNKSTRKTATGSLVSPNLKAILPGTGLQPMSLSSPALLPTPVVQVRKTSHKAAEQKRRDSLKTTFDDLRMLLPPIPLPTDDKFPADEILPGALPPRGPPKAGGEGPNKGVSKLQLLMCGNEFIRVLKARVERRDEEIDRLRREVRRMRIGMPMGEGEEEVDLERDLDAVEVLGGGALGMGEGPVGGGGMMPTLGEDEEDDDPGED